jgi:hypothetical protein
MPFLNPDHRPNIEHPQGHIVDVKVSFKKTGELKPLYFRIEDDYEERFTFSLLCSHLRKEHNYIMFFDCEYQAYNCRNYVTLIFDVTKNVWTVG